MAQESAPSDAKLKAELEELEKVIAEKEEDIDAANAETAKANAKVVECENKYLKLQDECQQAVRAAQEQAEALGFSLAAPKSEPAPEDFEAKVKALLKQEDEKEKAKGGGASPTQARKSLIATIDQIKASAKALGLSEDLKDRLDNINETIANLPEPDLEAQAKYFDERANYLFDLLDVDTQSSVDLQEQLCKSLENARQQSNTAIMRYLALRFTAVCRGFNPDY